MELAEEIRLAFNEFKTQNTARHDSLNERLNELEDRINRNATRGRSGVPHDTAGRTEALKNLHAYLAGRSNQMSVVSDPDGGYLVGSELAAIIEPVLRDVSALRRLCVPKTIKDADSYVDIFAVNGLVSTWIGETQTRGETEDTPGFVLITTFLRELYVQPVATQRLLDLASFDVEGFLREEIGESSAELEGEYFITGDGVGRPRGLLTYPASADADVTRPFGEIEYLASGEATALTPDSIRKLPLRLHPKYRRNGHWLLNSDTASDISIMKDGSGRYLWSDGLENGQPARLMGYPVEIDPNMPSIEAAAFPIAFADFTRAYRVVDLESGPKLLRDPYTTKGKVKFLATRYVGGGLRDSRAIKLLKIAAS